ncbi:hypothetical protein [Streptomyces sp. 891-h]|uniref:hypothetical protein n=1 Tax=Streptomyces sp. 891-h TaxID=2720714 RepID=UPI001FAAC897|nr:hypothetical protein [Streptomyces sp. 891-h]UNZ18546.1 hypothetical protein HC362_17400 [Streptomyces sp. 891-h]
MPKQNQRKPVGRATPVDRATTEVKRLASQLRELVDATGLPDKAVAKEMGIQPGTLSRLLSCRQIVKGRTEQLHDVTCRLAGKVLISRKDLLTLHYKAALSAPEAYKREFKKARKHLPVPSAGGDRQAHTSSTRAELFLADLLKQEGRPMPETLDVLRAGADVLGPPEAANVMANLRQWGDAALAEDFAQIYGREQDPLRVIHTARDLLDPYEQPDAASKLLTAALPPGHAGSVP